MPEIFGIIYTVTNLESGHQYVGQTTMRLRERWYGHKRAARSQILKTALCKAMASYGTENFKCEEIAKAFSREELDTLEQYYIKELNTLSPNGYNLTTGGYGFNHLPETKEKLRNLLVPGHPFLTAWLGKHHSEETKQKMAEAKLGTHQSDIHKENMSIGVKRMYSELRADPEAYESFISPKRDTSHLHTPEVEAKSAQGKIGGHPQYSGERNEKISKTLKEKGHKPSAECSEKARLSRIGSHHSEETRLKIKMNRKPTPAHNKTNLTEEQVVLIKKMLLQGKGARVISIALFGSYRKAVIYRILRELAPTN